MVHGRSQNPFSFLSMPRLYGIVVGIVREVVLTMVARPTLQPIELKHVNGQDEQLLYTCYGGMCPSVCRREPANCVHGHRTLIDGS